MNVCRSLMTGLFGLLSPLVLCGQAPVPSSAAAVFTIVFDVKGVGSDGTTASSKVEVQFAPAPVHNYQEVFRARGGLFGLRAGEQLGFGILAHKGSASAGGRTLSGPGAVQRDAAGVNWSLREDAAGFLRTETGGEISFGVVTYQDEDPPDFCLLSPGAYDYGAGNEDYSRVLTFRFTNEELRNLGRVRKMNQATVSDSIAGVQQTYKILFSGGMPEDETEVTVKPVDYDNWIPEGNLEKPTEVGKRLRIKLEAHKKGDPSVKRRVDLELSLKDVSKEKGVCLNWPSVGAKSDEDLKLLQDENPELDVTGPGLAKTREPVESLELVVTAHDFGAWGTLHVAAKDEAKHEAKVTVQGEDSPDLLIPNDVNRNHIADAWEVKWGQGGPASEDQDGAPVGDGHTGDVLTLYEEYRGFRISGGPEQTAGGGPPRELMTGKHVRTSPQVKDVFICDTLGLGIGEFRSSGLQVHLVKLEECGHSQTGAYNTHTISPNRGHATLGEQHVLWLEAGNTGTGYVGEAIMKGGVPSVPRDCQRIIVGAPVATGTTLLRPDQETSVTITHELAHACNVKHHGGEAAVEVVRSEDLSDHTQATGSWLLVSEEGHSTASGDVHCYMSYTPNFVQNLTNPGFWVWDQAGKRYTATLWKITSQRFAKYRFCDADSVELGPAGPAAPGLGNCIHQFCVNSLKH